MAKKKQKKENAEISEVKDIINNTKLISNEELVEKGYLSELNREFLHQYGLNMFVDGDQLKVADLRDGEDSPILYLDMMTAREHIEKIKKLQAEKATQREKRIKKYGFGAQPVSALKAEALNVLHAINK